MPVIEKNTYQVNKTLEIRKRIFDNHGLSAHGTRKTFNPFPQMLVHPMTVVINACHSKRNANDYSPDRFVVQQQLFNKSYNETKSVRAL
jgi:hypothetical protein